VSAAGTYAHLAVLAHEGVSCVLVVLVDALGSTPQDAGAKMIVTAAGIHSGTVGGGRVEAKALAVAADMLAEGATETRFATWTLKGDVGMTCGGSVKFYFEPHPAGGPWPIVIFGAGHVAQALLPVLLPLPCSVLCCDSRTEWLEKLPRAANMRVVAAKDPASLIPTLPDNAFVLCMTHGHQTDRPILHRALAERNFPFVGVIGSAAKAAVLRRELVAAGLSAARAGQFHCPLGLDFGSNHPHEIALSITAQLLTERDRWRAQGKARASGATAPR